ncbi:zinc finger protein 135-like isoform X1 [Pieris napi]|uniref:zinc finger protein 135-like isoform X1 n=2 Tax=Pieris napi TaxID=78633 RepID=UPI001FB9B163|nr:zinc finger protein 135-like isoform X1 [Pieris napi]
MSVMNTNKVADVSSLCRICLNCVNNAMDLFNPDGKSKDILNTLLECFQIVLSNEKNLPHLICYECVDELETANKFRQKCITFNERFLTICQEIYFDNDLRKCVEKDNKDDNFNHELPVNQDEILDSHENVNKGLSQYQCRMCDKVLENGMLFKQHMKTHKGNVGKITGFGASRRYHCSRCTYSTPHSQTLVNHMRRHNGERPYHCECGKSFTQSSSLSAHKKTHSNLTYYMCTVCGKQFKHAFTLKKHSKVHENATFSCNLCQKKLKSQESLQDHMHRHYNVRNYNCEDCGDTFVTSSELLNHKKKHSLEKKVECHLCGYKTHTKKNLIVHLKRHAGDKSYKCRVCNVAFFSSGDVQRHQRVHTREKPFTCPVCVQRFTYSTSLNKHMMTVHNIKYKWADFKWKESRTVKSSIQIKL